MPRLRSPRGNTTWVNFLAGTAPWGAVQYQLRLKWPSELYNDLTVRTNIRTISDAYNQIEATRSSELVVMLVRR